MKEIPIGLTGQAEMMVTEDKTAQAIGSGTLPVFATPMMLSLIEQSAWQSVSPYLEEGQSTVGTLLQVSHDSATPVGMNVTAKTKVTQVNGRKITFSAEVYDDTGLIGKGIHERFIVSDEKFTAKAYSKKAESHN